MKSVESQFLTKIFLFIQFLAQELLKSPLFQIPHQNIAITNNILKKIKGDKLRSRRYQKDKKKNTSISPQPWNKKNNLLEERKDKENHK